MDTLLFTSYTIDYMYLKCQPFPVSGMSVSPATMEIPSLKLKKEYKKWITLVRHNIFRKMRNLGSPALIKNYPRKIIQYVFPIQMILWKNCSINLV